MWKKVSKIGQIYFYDINLEKSFEHFLSTKYGIFWNTIRDGTKLV